jgi:outer membrane protein TolC
MLHATIRAGSGRGVGRALLALSLTTSLSACAMYHPRSLPSAADTRPDAAGLKVNLARLRLSPLKPIVVDATDGLDPLEVAVLAVLNSPDLQAKRAALGVDAAQVFAAGLLPDPQINAGFDHPTAGPDNQNAYSVSPSLDLAALIARSSARRASRFTARQADLNLLWAEWGAAQQARQLAETVLANEGRAVHLRKVLDAAGDRYARSSRALDRRDVTLQTAAADLAVKLDAQAQLATAEHDGKKARRDLNALLNLDAAVVLPLTPGPALAAYDPAAVQQALAALPDRRPDLLALKAGYGAQDANVRAAVLAQFPLTQIAAAFAKDPTGVVTEGISLAFALPIFNGGRGQVRIQDATREQLRAEYQARLDQTDAEVKNAEAELIAARRQAAALRADVPRLEALVQPAVAAYARGDIDSQTYLTLSQNVLSKRADLDDRDLAARLAEIQLETALFLPPANSRAPQ